MPTEFVTDSAKFQLNSNPLDVDGRGTDDDNIKGRQEVGRPWNGDFFLRHITYSYLLARACSLSLARFINVTYTEM